MITCRWEAIPKNTKDAVLRDSSDWSSLLSLLLYIFEAVVACGGGDPAAAALPTWVGFEEDPVLLMTCWWCKDFMAGFSLHVFLSLNSSTAATLPTAVQTLLFQLVVLKENGPVKNHARLNTAEIPCLLF